MATPVEMPKLGNTVEECLITAWHKHPGDAVAVGDVLAEVETDKATFDVTAPSGGTLLSVFFDAGALVPVFTTLCVVGEPGEDGEAFRPGSGAAVPAAAAAPTAAAPPVVEPAAPTVPTQVVPAQVVPAQVVPAQVVPAAPVAVPATLPTAAPWSPRARRFARDHDLAVEPLPGSGVGGRVVEADVRDRFFTTPRITGAARAQLADGHRAGGPGSGPGGMLRTADLTPDVPATVTTPETVTTPATPEPSTAQLVPVTPVRARIAKRLRDSLTTTAQYTLHTSANAAGLLAARRRLKADPATAGVTVNDLVVHCTVLALLKLPALNVEFVDGAIRRHTDVNIGFACDTDRGLVVPVVHRAQNLSLVGLAARSKELATQAVAGTIGVDDMTGGTFTVSNLGSLGIESFTPVLNPPQVAILGVGAITLKAARNASGNVEFIDAIGLSLTLDHQVIDGAPGARFLQVLRATIEDAGATCTI